MKKKVYFGFVDSEKAFHRVSSKVISKARCKLSIEKWLLSAVMAMHDDTRNMIRTVYCNAEAFLRLLWTQFLESFGLVYPGNCYRRMIWP